MYIHKWGVCSALQLENKLPGRIAKIPNQENVPRSLKRKMGRLSKIMYAASAEALDSLSGTTNFPLVVGTAYGEIETGINVLTDIFDSKGSLVRPIKVQNSVHVSSSGYLGILFSNHGPTLTVSQGFLTAEASLSAINTLLTADEFPFGLMVAGDIFNPEWGNELKDASFENYQRIKAEVWNEGAVSIMLGTKPPKTTTFGLWKIEGGVFRLNSLSFKQWLNAATRDLHQKTKVLTRKLTPLSIKELEILKEKTNFELEEPVSGLGTILSGPLEEIIKEIAKNEKKAILSLARQDDEMGYVKCVRFD